MKQKTGSGSAFQEKHGLATPGIYVRDAPGFGECGAGFSRRRGHRKAPDGSRNSPYNRAAGAMVRRERSVSTAGCESWGGRSGRPPGMPAETFAPGLRKTIENAA